MPSLPFKHCFTFRFSFRGCVSLLLLANWVLLCTGVPLPVFLAKELAQPFPCMNCSCGCATAAQCWKDCCCFTPAEKLIWAKENGVTPPDYAVQAAKKQAATCSRPCCAKQRSCCAPKPKKGSPDAAKPTSSAATLVLIDAMKCRGVGDSWINGVGICILAPMVSVRAVSLHIDTLIVLDEYFRAGPLRPPFPPPDARPALATT